MSDKFSTGDRVILTGEHITPNKQWPKWGSSHACVGTIMATYELAVNIRWDNSYELSASRDHISHYTRLNQNDPNLSFVKHKLRKTNGRL